MFFHSELNGLEKKNRECPEGTFVISLILYFRIITE